MPKSSLVCCQIESGQSIRFWVVEFPNPLAAQVRWGPCIAFESKRSIKLTYLTLCVGKTGSTAIIITICIFNAR